MTCLGVDVEALVDDPMGVENEKGLGAAIMGTPPQLAQPVDAFLRMPRNFSIVRSIQMDGT